MKPFDEQGSKAINALLIEDEESHAALLLELIDAIDFIDIKVSHVAGAFGEATKLLEGNAFDLIFSDLSLPDSSYDETLPRLKEIAGQTPIIVLTSLDDWKTISTVIKNGANDCIPKLQLDSETFQGLSITQWNGLNWHSP